MSAIGAVSGIAVPQIAQAGQAMKPVDRDGDHDNNKPDAPAQQKSGAHAVGQHNQHKLNIEV